MSYDGCRARSARNNVPGLAATRRWRIVIGTAGGCPQSRPRHRPHERPERRSQRGQAWRQRPLYQPTGHRRSAALLAISLGFRPRERAGRVCDCPGRRWSSASPPRPAKLSRDSRMTPVNGLPAMVLGPYSIATTGGIVGSTRPEFSVPVCADCCMPWETHRVSCLLAMGILRVARV